jgi:RimJ/RimL family protein N-acetyltransferase
MKPLRTGRLILRQWEERDRPFFHRINSDDRVMHFFSARRDRAQSDAMMDRFVAEIERYGFGFAAAEIAETGETIGFIGLEHCDVSTEFIPAGAVEVGWRLAPEFWGKGYASEGANAWLDFGFGSIGLAEIFSFAVWNNDPSTAVMRRIGMEHVAGAEFDHPSVPDTHPHLKRHVLYRISHEQWAARVG